MARLLSPAGQKIGSEFLINQFTTYNQRTPAVAALPNGGFVVTWVSEQEQLVARRPGNQYDVCRRQQRPPAPSVDIYARLYNSNGVAQSRRVSRGYQLPIPARTRRWPRRRTAASWSPGARSTWSNSTNGWDIYARPFSSAGAGGAVGAREYLFARRPIRAAHQRHWRGLFDCLDEFVARTARAKACMDSLCMRTVRWWAANFA